MSKTGNRKIVLNARAIEAPAASAFHPAPGVAVTPRPRRLDVDREGIVNCRDRVQRIFSALREREDHSDQVLRSLADWP